MQIISGVNEGVLKILDKFKKLDGRNRLLYYCVEVPVDEGVLLFNLLTRELVLLEQAEYQSMMEDEYLKDHWFIVPAGSSDKEYADLVSWVLGSRKPKLKTIAYYTIFTTTDCNARCFYCYEMGRSRIAMSAETAKKVVYYIQDHCGGEKVKLNWYGGEPLLNKGVIDIICQGLAKTGIEYTSSAISNGYLFNKETVENAVNNWNLKRVQITLDGTEAVYNKIKGFIYRENSPYRVVLDNIGYLLDASVRVSVRMNMDMHNAEDLLLLVEELARRFEGKEGLSVYTHHIFKWNEPMAQLHSEEEWEKRDAVMCRLNEKIQQCDLADRRGISKTLKQNHCMADSGSAVTVLPDGNIGACDHFSEDEFIGHIDREGFDQAVVDSWKERIPEIPECAECFYYPECMQLKKCASGSVCFEHLRRERRRKTERQMLNEYRMWKNRETAEQTDEDAIC
ncbi:MAG: 4Fe-4S cluster-binding domain-containing protein [Oscillospiraceae bacterium]|nr:4Fe-4S cluster-binding domain-containing protein [Oscillospiraceae bacterium]